MIKAIIKGVMKLVIGLVDIILSPIDAMINSALPSLADAFDLIHDFFNYIGDIVPWLISYLGIEPFVLNIIIDLLTFILTVPILVHTIKLAVAWYNKLKI